jgi:hypothetical protein
VTEPIDTSTCAERLLLLAEKPEYAAIRGELIHAASELNGLNALLTYQMMSRRERFSMWFQEKWAALRPDV